MVQVGGEEKAIPRLLELVTITADELKSTLTVGTPTLLLCTNPLAEAKVRPIDAGGTAKGV
jgi:hypothetical protein